MRTKLWIIAAAMAVIACQELPPVNAPEVEPQKQEGEPGLPPIDETGGPTLINAEIPPVVSTKVSLTAGDAPGLSLAWEKGDALRINGERFSVVEEGMTASKAGFKGPSLNGSIFTVLYPGNFENEDDWKARSYEGQIQTGNGSTAHLRWNAKLSGLSSYGALFFADMPGQEFVQNGVIKFSFNLPERFAGLESIGLTLPEAVIPLTNDPEGEKAATLSIGLKEVDVTEESREIAAYMMVPPAMIVLEPGCIYTITLSGPDGQTEAIEKTVDADGLVFGAGRVTVLSLDADDLQEPLFWGGEGTENSPYQIKSLKHLQNMNDLIVSNAGASKLYFKLVGDIDMAGVDWVYKNNSIGNNFPINFDGDGHTISNFNMTQWSASLFGAIKGEVYNLKFKDATIVTNTASASRGGLLAYRAGGTDTAAYIHDITVDGLSVTGTTSAVGGLVGGLTNGTIENCIITGLNLTAQAAAGGIVGEILDAESAVKECSVSGTVTFSGGASGDTYQGGIVGKVAADGTISRCHSSVILQGSVHTKILGGIVGGATANVIIEESAFDGSLDCINSQGGGILGRANKAAVIRNCYSSGSVTADSGYSGGILGYSASENDMEINISDCYSTLSFSPTNTYSANAVGGMIGGHDKATKKWCVSGLLAWHRKISFPNMGNATYGVIVGQMHSGASSAATSFSNCWYRSDLDYTLKGAVKTPRSDEDITVGGKKTYDGKPAAGGMTCSQKAQEVGWSADFWDFSNDYPALKNLP